MTSPGRSLSPRQQEILRLLTQGRSNKEIAAALGLTDGTVKQHLHQLFRKLGVHNRALAAVHGAARAGEAESPRAAVPPPMEQPDAADRFAFRLITSVAAEPRLRGAESSQGLQRWTRQLSLFTERGQRLAQWFDGHLQALPGGTLVVWFGLHTSHGDDAARALAFSRALRASVEDLGALDLAIGLGTALEVVRENVSGEPLASRAFRLSLRLAEQAAGGRIRACANTLRSADIADLARVEELPDEASARDVAEDHGDPAAAGRWGGLPFLPALCQAVVAGQAQWLAVESWPPRDGARLSDALAGEIGRWGLQVCHLWLPAPDPDHDRLRGSLSGQLQMHRPGGQRAAPTHGRRLIEDIAERLQGGPLALILHGMDGLARVQTLFDDKALQRLSLSPLLVIGSSLRRQGQAQTSLRLLGSHPGQAAFTRVLRLEVPRTDLDPRPGVRPDTQAMLDRVSAFARAVARERTRVARATIEVLARRLQASAAQVAAACRELEREGLVVMQGRRLEFRDPETASAVRATTLADENP